MSKPRARTRRADSRDGAGQGEPPAPPRRERRRRALPLAPATEPLPAGSFAQWLQAARSAREQRRDVDVPCGACTACCRSSLFIHIEPDEHDTLAHIDPRLLFPAPGAPPGHVLMGYDRQGRCPMLTASGCSIYSQRPRTCRSFDCRAVAATAIPLDEAQRAIAEQAERWRFEHPEPEDSQQHAAVRAAARFLIERGPELLPDALPSHPLQLAQLALRVHEVFYEPGADSSASTPSDAERARAVRAAMSRAAGRDAGPPRAARATSVGRRRSSRA